MLKEIKKIIQSMDVKTDRETAHVLAQSIYKLGPDALDALVEIGRSVDVHEKDMPTRTRLIRGIIFSLAKFGKKKLFRKPRLFKHEAAVELLCEFSEQGFNSARTTLHQIGISDADIMKKILMSLPVVDSRENDRGITLSEAVLEINLLELTSPVKKVKNQGYIIGIHENRSHGIFKIGPTDFVYRVTRM